MLVRSGIRAPSRAIGLMVSLGVATACGGETTSNDDDSSLNQSSSAGRSGIDGSGGIDMGEAGTPRDSEPENVDATCYGWDGIALQPLVPGSYLGKGMVSYWESAQVDGRTDQRTSCPESILLGEHNAFLSSVAFEESLDASGFLGTLCCYVLSTPVCLECRSSFCGDEGDPCNNAQPCCARSSAGGELGCGGESCAHWLPK